MRIDVACVMVMPQPYQVRSLLQRLESGHPPERLSALTKQEMRKSCNPICGEQNCFMSTLRHSSWIVT
jgi:hypothetical protein